MEETGRKKNAHVRADGNTTSYILVRRFFLRKQLEEDDVEQLCASLDVNHN